MCFVLSKKIKEYEYYCFEIVFQHYHLIYTTF